MENGSTVLGGELSELLLRCYANRLGPSGRMIEYNTETPRFAALSTIPNLYVVGSGL